MIATSIVLFAIITCSLAQIRPFPPGVTSASVYSVATLTHITPSGSGTVQIPFALQYIGDDQGNFKGRVQPVSMDQNVSRTQIWITGDSNGLDIILYNPSPCVRITIPRSSKLWYPVIQQDWQKFFTFACNATGQQGWGSIWNAMVDDKSFLNIANTMCVDDKGLITDATIASRVNLPNQPVVVTTTVLNIEHLGDPRMDLMEEHKPDPASCTQIKPPKFFKSLLGLFD